MRRPWSSWPSVRHRRTFKGDSYIPAGTTHLSVVERFVALCWEVLMEHRVAPNDLRLVMFFDN